ncbi:hypothetical protein [Gordonia cholesterolivorans]|uniref:GIY-YIG nuclease family protein n=1 Tax=Gordonia cholesterolivorans TaxID=559625 RepID=A0ABN3HCE5_9ACTN
MFDEFTKFYGTAAVPAIRFEAVRDLTQLDWRKVDDASEIPTEPGVYAWVDQDGFVRYHGSGRGAAGIHGRLRNQLSWRQNQRNRIAAAEKDDDIDEWFRAAIESPAIRLTAEIDCDLWVAVATDSSWELGTDEDDDLPTTALGWESFISELSHLTTGRRSLLGGGAWESKRGTLGDTMERVAWSRLQQVLQQCK